MRPQPEFGGSCARIKSTKGDIGYDKEWTLVTVSDVSRYLEKQLMYLGVEESNVFVDRLPQAMGMRKCIISCQEIPYWLCTEITISNTVKRAPLDRP